jgi:hypothetical protein
VCTDGTLDLFSSLGETKEAAAAAGDFIYLQAKNRKRSGHEQKMSSALCARWVLIFTTRRESIMILQRLSPSAKRIPVKIDKIWMANYKGIMENNNAIFTRAQIYC